VPEGVCTGDADRVDEPPDPAVQGVVG
jgi:hypothetical protein